MRRSPLFADAAPMVSDKVALRPPYQSLRRKVMAEEEGESTGAGLVAKILVVSGLLFCIVGVFLILFVNTVVGIVLLAVGLSDLVTSFILPKITT